MLFSAIVYVLMSGCAWRALPPCFRISKSTAHRRFAIWSRAELWGRLHEAVLDRIHECGLLDLSRVVLDSANDEYTTRYYTHVRDMAVLAAEVETLREK